MSRGPVVSLSYSTRARFVIRFTLPDTTPSTPAIAASTEEEHALHVMPSMSTTTSAVRGEAGSSSPGAAEEEEDSPRPGAEVDLSRRASKPASSIASITPASAPSECSTRQVSCVRFTDAARTPATLRTTFSTVPEHDEQTIPLTSTSLTAHPPPPPPPTPPGRRSAADTISRPPMTTRGRGRTRPRPRRADRTPPPALPRPSFEKARE